MSTGRVEINLFHLTVADRVLLWIFSRKGLDQFEFDVRTFCTGIRTAASMDLQPRAGSSFVGCWCGLALASSMRRTSAIASVACSAARTVAPTRPSIWTTASALCWAVRRLRPKAKFAIFILCSPRMVPNTGHYAGHVQVADEQQGSVQRGFDIDAVASQQPR